MKRILHISKYYYPFRGGTEQIAKDCVSALKGQYEQKVVCFNHTSGNEADIVDGVDILRVGCLGKLSSQPLSLGYGKTLKTAILDFQPDIIIFHYPNPLAAHWLLKYSMSDTKLVLYWHLDIVRQKYLGKLFEGQNRRLIRRADKIIATSPNYIAGSRWLRSAKEKCVVIPNCVRVERLTVTEKIREKADGIRKTYDGKTICFAVGRHVPYKGITYLVQASKYLDERFMVLIGGEGELTESLKKEAGTDSKIVFLGRVSDEDLVAYFLTCDIFAFPSITKNEAFGVALAEGMYFGNPAVTFTIPGSGVNYVNLDGVTGIECPNADSRAFAEAIRKLAGDRGLMARYGKNARERVMENFMFDTFKKKVVQAIE